jgi:hypothetical protein
MTPPRPRSVAHRLLIGILAALAVLAAAHTGLWWFATGRLADELTAWQGQNRPAGWMISVGVPVRTGWPLAAAIAVPDVMLAGGEADIPGGLSWRAAHAELAVALLAPRQLRIRVTGQQSLRLSGLPEFAFTANQFELTIPLDPGVPSHSGDLAASGLHAALASGSFDIATLALHTDSRAAAIKGEEALAITGSAEAIGLPFLQGGHPWPFGRRITSVSFDAALTGPLPRATDLTTRAAAWRDGGGTLELRRLALGWGPLGLSGNATMTLDAPMQPQGTATVRLVGYDAMLDALVSSGTLAPRSALAAKGILAILAQPPEGGGAPQVELPLTLHDRTLSAGRFPLLRLPEWVWP